MGALLVKPQRVDCSFGVIFFNNVGYSGDVRARHDRPDRIASLGGRTRAGAIKIETPVGAVDAELHTDGRIRCAMSRATGRRASSRLRCRASDPRSGTWPGAGIGSIDLAKTDDLVLRRRAVDGIRWRIRQAINAQGLPQVDHVELFGPPSVARR